MNFLNALVTSVCILIRSLPQYLGDAVGVVFVLQQQRYRLDVIFLGGDVQRRKLKPRTSFCLKQHCRHLVMVLLNSN